MTNAFETGARKVIPAVLVYVRAALPDGERVLMLHRNSPDRPDDYHAGKWNGLGGKLEPDESFVDAARREVREESGLEVQDVRPLGVLQFPSFKAHKDEDWLVFVLTADVGVDAVSRPLSGPEGDLHWKRSDELLSLNLWPGDRFFIEHVIARRPFAGTIWYRGKDVERATVAPLG
jgi:8-oxo-dGTP diphosphatase